MGLFKLKTYSLQPFQKGSKISVPILYASPCNISLHLKIALFLRLAYSPRFITNSEISRSERGLSDLDRTRDDDVDSRI
jgi:hypothetical protein